MKLRRLLSCTLALLLVVSLLPISALADTIPDNNTLLESVQKDQTMVNNNGSVDVNLGTIETNQGTVGSYTDAEKTTPDTNTGNFGTVETNEGKVLINQEGGTVETNTENGTVKINRGTVGSYVDPEKTTPDTNTGNFGTVETNEGTVLINQEGGIIETNKGTVGKENEDGSVVDDSGNSGTININDGKVLANYRTGTIGTNDGIVGFSSGKITTNNDIVSVNSPEGTVGTNNGYVGNCGTVEINAINGIVRNEPAMDQGGNSITGKVNTNYGTVYDYDAETGSRVTTYGVQIQNTDGGAGTKLLQALETEILKLAGLFQRDGYELVGFEDITPPSNKEKPGEEEPDEKDSNDDGVLAAYALNPDVPELSATDFQAYRPSILSLIWKAIAKPASSGGAGDAGPAVLTRLSADKVRVGTLIRCGNLIFKIIEVNDDSIRVATVCMLSQQNQADMMGYLKQYLSAAQIAKFIGQPELLEEDEIAEFFGDNRAHIAFYAAKDLFEKN